MAEKEYIEREAVLEKISHMTIRPEDIYDYGIMAGVDAVRKLIESVPAADVAPVRHGRWLHRKNGVAYCSECEIDAVEDETEYCPNCGAKMDLEGGNT